MNGLLRQYMPKGTDLSIYSQEQLDAIADQINNRPRKGWGYDPLWRYTPSCCATAFYIPPSFIKPRVLHFTFESALRYRTAMEGIITD